MTEVLLWVAQGIGLFYLFGAVVLLRSMVMDRLMDRVLAALTLEPTPSKERLRRWLITFGALVIGAGGVALVLRNELAVPLFAAAAGMQAGYLVWAQRAFRPDGPEDEAGRRQTVRAAVLYAAVLVLVMWLWQAGLLAPWNEPVALVPTGLTALGLAVWTVLQLRWKPRAIDEGDEPEAPEAALPPLRRIRIEPRWGLWSLRDADADEARSPSLYLPDAVADRFAAWELAFVADDDQLTVFAEYDDEAHERAHRAEGEAIRAELEALYGIGAVEGPIYPRDIRYRSSRSGQ